MATPQRLRGNHPVTADDKGRIKIPTAFRRVILDRHGDELFLTSFTGDYVRIYPLPEWQAVEERIAGLPAMEPARLRLEVRINYFGHMTNMDKQGRVLIPQLLREHARIEGGLVVMGQMNHLEVWNHDAFRQQLAAEPFTEDDFRTLADLGI